MVFARRTRQTRGSRQAGVAVAIVAAASVASSFITTSKRNGMRHGGDIGSMTTRLIFAAAVGLPVVIFVIVKAIRSGDDDGTRAEDAANAPDDDTDGAAPRAILLAIMAALIAIGVGMYAWMQTAR